MEASREKLQDSLCRAFVEAIDKVCAQGLFLSDMYVQIVTDDSVALSIYDDADNLLASAPLAAWDEWKSSIDDEDALARFITLLADTVHTDELYDRFKTLEYNGPFSLLLVDENMEVIEEIMTIDDENILLTDDLWEKMDRELDDFFDKLMSDVR